MKNLKQNPNFTSRRGMFPSLSRGFTLTELLVVIAIIAVLASISFLGVSKTKEKAESATCMSNLRQVGAAMVEYAVDNNGKLPPLANIDPETGKQNGIWTLVLARAGYLWDTPGVGTVPCGTGVWACPSCTFVNNNRGGYGVAEASVIQYDDRKSTVNSRNGRSEFGSLRLSTIEDPANTWLVGDSAITPDDPKSNWYAIWSNPSRWASGHLPGARHGGKANVCMVDGRVRSMTLKELAAGDYFMNE